MLALPNALIPSITVLGLALGDFCMAQCSPKPFLPGPEWVHGCNINTGARLPGSDGLCRRGFFAYVLVNLVVDLLYLWIDPRSDVEVVNDAKRGNVRRTPTKQTRFNGAKLVWMLKGSPLT